MLHRLPVAGDGHNALRRCRGIERNERRPAEEADEEGAGNNAADAQLGPQGVAVGRHHVSAGRTGRVSRQKRGHCRYLPP